MNAGILVAMGVVGALALFETALPRTFAALRNRLRKAKAEREIGTRLPLANAISAEPEAVATARNTASTPQSFSARVDARGACRASDLHFDEHEARRLWDEARKMKHQSIPDFSHDGEYLRLVNAAAEAGSMEAMDKLGTYAFRRNALVEAFYWKLLVRLGGGETHEVRLKDVRIAWMGCGCPMQYRNVYEGFGEEQGVFARAVLKIQCGIDVARAKNRIRELVKAGNPYAIRFDEYRRPIV